MYSDYAQLQQYDEYLKVKAQEFQNAQREAAWVRQWLQRRINQLGDGLVIGGQWLQAVGANKQNTIVAKSL